MSAAVIFDLITLSLGFMGLGVFISLMAFLFCDFAKHEPRQIYIVSLIGIIIFAIGAGMLGVSSFFGWVLV